MELLTRLNWVDVLIVIIMLRISYVAFQDGLSHEIFPLLGSICTVIFALHYYNGIASAISHNMNNVDVSVLEMVIFTLLAVGISFIFKFLKVVIDKIITVTWHPLIEKFGGLLSGIARASIVISIILIILSLMPLSYIQRSIRDRSFAGMYFLRIGPDIYARASGFIPTLRIRGASVKSESLVKDLVSDKAVTKAVKTKKEKEEEYFPE
ncbi:MAG: CvpA family protein [Candidatus Omnitrophota bacterium]|nr:CvpA family protein [Candidatus Omnitrophota bacterium]